MSLFSWVRRHTAAVATGALIGLSSLSIHAQESTPVTLPDTGVDVAGYATTAITALGAIVAVVIGGTIAFILIRAGVRWIRGMK